MRVEQATSEQYEALIALGVRRNRHLSPSDAGWQLMVPETWPGLVALRAVRGDGTTIGYGWITRATHLPEGWAAEWVTVSAEAEGCGVGSALHRALAARTPAGTTLLTTKVFDDEPRSLEVARHWGYEVEELSIESALALVDLPEPLLPAGVELVACDDLRVRDQAAFDAMLRASQTNPEAVRGGRYVTAASLLSSSQGARSVGVLARVEGRPAAIAQGTVVGTELFVAYTGVDPVHRGHGLALTVKMELHRRAASAGAKVALTENEEHNHGIRAVNAALGYEVRQGTYRMRRPVGRA
ncbi:hypothetical protein [Nocardioides cremeus]|uniref:N-acetyltransferase domain-containing protein n=1 Tax=Nocardioides cremeus TaxID=3058044 RepID=A0ABT8TJX8_9ACTN|nr:hypothetical protein [Nocardioides cremeus]MDO3394268.1 hypothetical protein [Nocardioides cremeus]